MMAPVLSDIQVLTSANDKVSAIVSATDPLHWASLLLRFSWLSRGVTEGQDKGLHSGSSLRCAHLNT